MKTISVCAMLLAVHLSPVAAQTTVDKLNPGDRLRISVPEQHEGEFVAGTGRWMMGTLLRVDSGAIALKLQGQGDESEYTVPFDAIRDLEVSHGAMDSRDGLRRGAIRGALVGAAFGEAGLLIGRVAGGPASSEDDDCGTLCDLFVPSSRNIIRNGAVGASLGAMIGAILGSRSTERWERVGLPALAVQVRPDGIGFRIPTAR